MQPGRSKDGKVIKHTPNETNGFRSNHLKVSLVFNVLEPFHSWFISSIISYIRRYFDFVLQQCVSILPKLWVSSDFREDRVEVKVLRVASSLSPGVTDVTLQQNKR